MQTEASDTKVRDKGRDGELWSDILDDVNKMTHRADGVMKELKRSGKDDWACFFSLRRPKEVFTVSFSVFFCNFRCGKPDVTSLALLVGWCKVVYEHVRAEKGIS